MIALGPGLRMVRNWGESTPDRQWGPEQYLEAVVASVQGEPEPTGEVEGWVFAEDNPTAFMLWYQERIEQRYPDLHGIYLLLARETWYQHELQETIPSLVVPPLGTVYEQLPHEAASRELIAANTGSERPLYLSPIILPPGDIYGVLVPQGVLFRLEPPGYQVGVEDVQRHVSILEALAPGFQRESLTGLDSDSRDWWSERHRLLGEAWVRLGMLPAAEAEFRAAARTNPGRPETWMDLALFFSTVGDWNGMEATLREALALRPRDKGLLVELARALTRQGAFEEAAEVLPTGRLGKVPRENYLRVRAGISLGLGNVTSARDDLEEAARLAPESSEVWNDLGVVYLEKGQWDEAVEAFTRAVELQPDLGEALANLGMIAFRDARWADADEYFTKARQAGVSNAQLGFNLGTARVNLDDLPGAEEAFRENIREWPRHADSYIALAALLERAGRVQEALRVLEAGRMTMPEDARFGMLLRRLRVPPAL
jgi:Flp pilus assembly protein TadD